MTWINLAGTIVYFGLGLLLVLFSAERLVRGTVGTARSFGVPSFLISVVFIGFDPENLAVGAVGGARGMSGIALGSIVGAAMVAIGLAFGVTAVLCPMRFAKTAPQLLAVPLAAVAVLWLLGADGELTRPDGALLFAGYLLALVYLLRLGRRGVTVSAGDEVGETLRTMAGVSKGKAVSILLLSLLGLLAGSLLLVGAAERAIEGLGLSETVFGMTVLALIVSIEELARELPAALRGRPEISFGNVVGSILAFFLCNAGIIAMVRPLTVDASVLRFYVPMCMVTVVVIVGFMFTNRVPRWAGVVLVALYGLFVAGAYATATVGPAGP